MVALSSTELKDTSLTAVSEVVTRNGDNFPVIKGDFDSLPSQVKDLVTKKVDLMKPKYIYICNGSEKGNQEIIKECVEKGVLKPLKAYKNCYFCRIDPRDVALVESKTFMIPLENMTQLPYSGRRKYYHGPMGLTERIRKNA